MVWLSICSAHRVRDPNCMQCNCGLEFTEEELQEWADEFNRSKTVCACCGFEYCNCDACPLCSYPQEPKGTWGKLFCGLLGGHFWRNRYLESGDRRWYCVECGKTITKPQLQIPSSPPNRKLP